MKKQLIIVGAGGHGKVCAEIAEMNGYDRIAFLDDKPNEAAAVLGTTEDIGRYVAEYAFFVAIGNNQARKAISEKIRSLGGEIVTLIHPKAVVSRSAEIGPGTVVMAGAVVNAEAEIGNGTILNTCSSVDHDCKIGEYSHIAVGAHLAGTVCLGKETFIGAGAVVINNLCLCDNVIIGAGAVVVSNLEEAGTYVGLPARKTP